MEAGLDTQQMIKLYQKSKEKVDLVLEIKAKDELIEKYVEREANLSKDIKLLNSIIRIPRVCYKFQKALRKKNTEAEDQKKEQNHAYENLKAEIEKEENDEVKFVETFLTRIDTTYPIDKLEPFKPILINDTENLSSEQKEN